MQTKNKTIFTKHSNLQKFHALFTLSSQSVFKSIVNQTPRVTLRCFLCHRTNRWLFETE